MKLLESRLAIYPRPSPHRRSRRGRPVNLIVIHAISCPPGALGSADIVDLFLGRLDPARHPSYAELAGKELSAHFLIDRRGKTIQFVEIGRAAYHAGRSSWDGEFECNDFSIGIELVGGEGRPFTSRQYRTLVRLCRDLMKVCPAITPERIVGHSDIAPGRKTDPGRFFEWNRFRTLLGSALES